MAWGLIFTAVFLAIMAGLAIREYWRNAGEDEDDA
jgi:hypothetical protein